LKIQGKYLFAVVLLIFSVGLAYDSIENYINPYLSVTQVAINREQYSGRNVQVMGIVAEGSFIRGDGTTIRFTLTDGTESLDVQYSGAIPLNFDEGKDVVAVGSFAGEEAFEAAQILVKCPSKYEGENPPQQNNHMFIAGVGLALVAIGYLVFTTLWKRG